MRRATRLERPIGLLKVRVASQTPSPYLCLACKYQASFSTSAIRAADTKAPFTEKIRQRIWGTDAPPGLENPYGNKSVFDRTKTRAQEQKVEEREEELKEERKAAAPDMSTYEPAETWDGLEKVGGFGHWWKENWDADHRFKGFLPAEVMTDTHEVTTALHRAIVEVLALQQAGMQLEDISKGIPGEDLTHEVQIRSSPTGITLQFTEGASLEDIAQSLAPAVDETAEKSDPTESEEDVAADRSSVDPLHPEATSTGTEETSTKEFPTESEEDVAADRSNEDPLDKLASTLTYDALVASWDPSWLQISLENPEMKFAVLKRTLQLTGVRIPDSAINSSRTVQALLAHLITPPKPRKLVDALKQKEDLLALPNVSVFERRVTPIDKEKSVGRWKIIEQELKRRDLPLTGH